MPRGEAIQPQGTIAACALLFKALDSALLLYNLSSVDFWTFPQPPGHQDCHCTRRRWLLAMLGHGRQDEKGGVYFNLCLHRTCPAQAGVHQ